MQNNQNDYEMHFVIITQEILSNKQLNAIEKLILARISGFEEFFEAAIMTAELLGTTEIVVQRAKRKLLKLNFIEEIANTGHGKRYRINHNEMWKSQSRPDKKVRSDMTKKSHQTLQKSHIENKDKIKKELNGATAPVEPVEKSEEEFGDPKINDFMKKWNAATGENCSNIKRERRAAHNLLKSQSKEGIDAILAAVQQIHESGDQYAPSITLPSDLVGQYSKLSKLRLYVAKQDTQKRAKIKRTLVLDYDGLPPAYEVSEAERNKVKEQIKAMRESGMMPWQTQSA